MEFNSEIKKFMDDFININQSRLDMARNTTSALSDYLSNNLEGFLSSVYQGSFSYGTIVKPHPETDDGQYDVDLAVKIAYNKDFLGGERKYYDNLYNCLKNSDRYSSKVSNEKERAVRVYYESNDGEFYVDLVPMFEENGKFRVIDHKSNTKEISGGSIFKDWVNKQNNKTSIEGSQEEFLKKIIRIFKFLRNQESISDIKSVQLTLLLARQVDKLEDKCFSSISSTLFYIGKSLKEELEGCKTVSDLDLSNPELPEEVFNRNFDETKFQNFKNSFITLVDTIIDAYNSNDIEESFSLRQSVFGDELTKNVHKIAQSYNFDHAQSIENCGYTKADSVDKIHISCRYKFKNLPWAGYKEKTHGKKIVRGSILEFYTVGLPKNINMASLIRQVTNNSSSAQIRGEINNPSKNLGYMDETKGYTIQEEAQYTGRHWVKCYWVDNNRVIAESDNFYVNIQ